MREGWQLLDAMGDDDYLYGNDVASVCSLDLLGQGPFSLGRLEEAEDALLAAVVSPAVEARRRPLIALTTLAELYLETGQPEEALQYALEAERAVAQTRAGVGWRASAFTLLAEVYEALGQRKDEVWYQEQSFRLVEQINPSHFEPYTAILVRAAKDLLRMGETAEAEEALQKHLKSYRERYGEIFRAPQTVKTFDTALRLLVQVMRERGDLEGATLLAADLDRTQARMQELADSAAAEVEQELWGGGSVREGVVLKSGPFSSVEEAAAWAWPDDLDLDLDLDALPPRRRQRGGAQRAGGGDG
jgi:tetratricopeptide (TPR) repeat protein